MRHNKKINHLGRQAGHRKALMSNMASSLILHKRIETTVAKAKALRKFVEPLITKSKEDTTHSRRVVFSYLKDKYAVTELFREVAPRVADRPGGYTRILHTGFRLGDGSEMCIIELVDFNETYKAGAAPEAKARTRRSRGGAAKKAAAPVAEETVGAEADVPAEGTEEVQKTSAKKAPAKTAAPKPVAKPAPKTSGAKSAAVKTGATKKGDRTLIARYLIAERSACMVLRPVFLMGSDGASVCRRASVAGVEAPYVSAGAVFASSPMYDSRRKVLLYPETGVGRSRCL